MVCHFELDKALECMQFYCTWVSQCPISLAFIVVETKSSSLIVNTYFNGM